MQWKSSLHVKVKITPWHAHAGTQGWRRCSSNPLATRHLEEGGLSAPRCGRLTPEIAPVPIVQEAGRASGPVWTAPQISPACYVDCHIRFQVSAGDTTFSAFSDRRELVRSQALWVCNARTAKVPWCRVWFEPFTHVKWIVSHPAGIQENSWRALCRKPFLERYPIASTMRFPLSTRVIRNSRRLWFWNVPFRVHKQRSLIPCFVALESMPLNSNVLF
jgi:hypothetical protein